MEYLKREVLNEFIKRLPELSYNPPTVHLLMLAVRSRKAKQIFGMKMSDIVVERKVIRPLKYHVEAWRSRYYNKVYNLACLQHEGLYEMKSGNVEVLGIPEVMAIYGTLSPRNVYQATKTLMQDNIQFLYIHNEEGNVQLSKQGARFFGGLHKSKIRDFNYVTLDIDVLDENLLNEIRGRVEDKIPIFMVTETSRGYHIVLDISKSEHARLFYGEEKLMQKLGLEYAPKGMEIQRDAQEPIPGTVYYRDSGKRHYVKLMK